MAVADWVLGAFGAAEATNLSEVIENAAEVTEEFVRGGLQKAQQRASGRLGARGLEKES
jgi:peptidyl-tRNA hydrolase